MHFGLDSNLVWKHITAVLERSSLAASQGLEVAMLPALRQVTPEATSGIRWLEVRCSGCGRLLEKIEQYALRPGKHIEIKCGRCKVVTALVGTDSH